MSVHANDWTRLCELLDDDPELAPAVRLAVTDPAEYFAQHQGALLDRGVESADEVDPWTALIDGLDDAGALAYLDWKDSGVELADALPQLPRVFATGVDVDEVGDVDGALPAAITRADSILATHDLRIVYLDEDSDAYPLLVVPLTHAAEIVELSARLGFSARVFP